MDTPRSTPRNAGPTVSVIEPKVLFLAMACDLQIRNEPEVINAYSLLCARKHLAFVRMLDGWSSQMYNSIGDLGYRLHQLAGLFSKFPFEDDLIDRDAVALEKFRKSEHACKRMNQKLRARRGRVEPPHMQFMRDFIEAVIGREPPLPAIFGACDFGPGSSIGVHGNDVSVLNKLDALTVTPSCLPFAVAALRSNFHYAEYLALEKGALVDDVFYDRLGCSLVQHNKITCVPKNAKTNRTIAIEPALNGFVQKGVDVYLRGRLKRIGRDLSSQALNQSLARFGSCGRGYATIDLSAASDSISIELVRELLPPAWFSLLTAVRSPAYALPNGKVTRYEKFCSMGNGFCFPLETLLFTAASEYSMSRTAVYPNETFTVYGDDIIVPQSVSLLLLETLRDMGFRHNEDKTFIFGGFRESCGADFFNGVKVRPIYVKKPLKADHTLYYLLNELRRRKLMRSWTTLFEALPGRWRYTRPYPRDDDSAIDVPVDLFMTSRHARWDRDYQAWTWKRVTVVATAGRKPSGPIAMMAGKLRGDLTHSEAFSARFSERTRIQVGT